MPSQTLAITADANDGYENQFGFVDAGGTLVVQGGVDPMNDVRTAGLSFLLTTTIPSNATVTKAYLRLNADGADPGTTTTPNLQIESANPATNTVWSGTHLPSAATAIASHSAGSITFAANTWYFGESDTSPVNLATSIQSLITSYGELASGERINIFIESSITSGYAVFDDSQDVDDPALFIEWTVPAVDPEGQLIGGKLISGLLAGVLVN